MLELLGDSQPPKCTTMRKQQGTMLLQLVIKKKNNTDFIVPE